MNKVSSKVELNWDIRRSGLFSEDQKALLTEKLNNRINAEGILQVMTEEERSQYLNKERSVEKLLVLIGQALHRPKLRKATKPKKSAVEKRLKNKLQNAIKKVNRRNLEF